MSLARLNYIMTSGILPFNFGMNYESCLKFYDDFHDKFAELCPSDPRTWSQDVVDEVNKTAKEETELVDKLMALPDDEFYVEVKKLEV